MISEKVLGAYASVGALDASAQAEWYRRAGREWGIDCFEIPMLAGAAMAPELVQAFSEMRASLVVTLVAQWATKGQGNPAYGLSSLEESSRQEAIVDVCSVLQQCRALSEQGVEIRNVVVHTGQRAGKPIPHAIAFYRSLVQLRGTVAGLLPETVLAVELADSRPPDHPIPFPASKKGSLRLGCLISTLATVNREVGPGHPIPIVVNWGRVLIDGDDPLASIGEILASDVPLAGVIMSGAGASAQGFTDSHNSHLDPDSGFAEADAAACASTLASSPRSTFIGMKCSVAKGDGEVSVEEVLTAQANVLNDVA